MTRNQQKAINLLYSILAVPESTTEEGNYIYTIEIPPYIVDVLKALYKPLPKTNH